MGGGGRYGNRFINVEYTRGQKGVSTFWQTSPSSHTMLCEGSTLQFFAKAVFGSINALTLLLLLLLNDRFNGMLRIHILDNLPSSQTQTNAEPWIVPAVSLHGEPL